MGRDPAEQKALDPFPDRDRFSVTCPKGDNRKRTRRYVLPKNLRNAVKHLSDGELDLMHAATLEEIKRRGRTPKSVETDLTARSDLTKMQSPPTKRAKLNAAEILLPVVR